MDRMTFAIDPSTMKLRRVGRLARRRMRIDADQLVNGRHSDGTLTVEISGLGSPVAGVPDSFEWLADRPIALVIVRSGVDGEDVAFQVGPSLRGTGQGAGVGDGAGIRYVAFCYDAAPSEVAADAPAALPVSSALPVAAASRSGRRSDARWPRRGPSPRPAATGARSSPRCSRGPRAGRRRPADVQARPAARLDRRDRARRVARAERRWPEAARLEEPDHARAVAPPRLQQLDHPLVRSADLAGQAEGDEVREVEVADAHRVGIARGAEHHLGRGPRPDPGQRRQPGVGRVARAARGSPRSGRPGRRRAGRGRPAGARRRSGGTRGTGSRR